MFIHDWFKISKQIINTLSQYLEGTTKLTVSVYKNNQYSKTCLKRTLKTKTNIGFQDQLSLNVGQKYCRMLQWEHSALRSTFIKLPFVNYTFVLSSFEWPLKTGFTVHIKC